MCGRFSFAAKERIIEDRFNVSVDKTLYKPRYNCAPSQNIAIISNNHSHKLNYFKWGLQIGKINIINSRAETISEKSQFSYSFINRRCLIPADSYYEWARSPGKQPWRFLMKDNSLFSFAGIWYNTAKQINCFSIITTSANQIVKDVHHRMPVILHPEDETIWLNDNNIENLLALLKPFPQELMKCYKISNLVNNAQNDNPEIRDEI